MSRHLSIIQLTCLCCVADVHGACNHMVRGLDVGQMGSVLKVSRSKILTPALPLSSAMIWQVVLFPSIRKCNLHQSIAAQIRVGDLLGS